MWRTIYGAGLTAVTLESDFEPVNQTSYFCGYGFFLVYVCLSVNVEIFFKTSFEEYDICGIFDIY